MIFRALLSVLIGLGVLAPVEVEPGTDVRTSIVVCTTTRAQLVAAYANRQDLIIQNAGTLHVNVGRGTVMATLHVGATSVWSRLKLDNYQGGLDCATQSGTGSTAVEILEVIR